LRLVIDEKGWKELLAASWAAAAPESRPDRTYMSAVMRQEIMRIKIIVMSPITKPGVERHTSPLWSVAPTAGKKRQFFFD
jgi:hypothetical protein